jgi:hypothetical protein
MMSGEYDILKFQFETEEKAAAVTTKLKELRYCLLKSAVVVKFPMNKTVRRLIAEVMQSKNGAHTVELSDYDIDSVGGY